MSGCNFDLPELQALCERVAAQEEMRSSDANNFFLLWAATLVLFMHAGFAMLSAGAIRTKNTKNILISITMDLTVCAVAWYLCGYAFAFGNDKGGFIGSTFWVGIDVGSTLTGPPSYSLWLFEWAFAATAATIVSGAIAERARFETYLFYSFFMSFWVYPVVVHWVWGGGFLTLGNPNGLSLMQSGVVDFAGCGPVHMVGGLAGAIGAKIMGPRVGRFDPETGKAIPIPGHSSPLATLGVFILWVGWLGFNCGSVVNLSGGAGHVAARAGVNTVLSSSTAALSALVVSHLLSKERDFDLGMALNGALAGLVSITASAAYVEMWAGVSIGVIGGALYVWASRFTLNVLKIDDPLDATPVHFFCGIWGLIAGAFFASPNLLLFAFPFADPSDPNDSVLVPEGVFYGGNSRVVFVNGTVEPGHTKGPLVANAVVLICCVIAWVTVFMAPIFYFFHRAGLLRVPSDVEAEGLDVSHHGGGAYPDLFHAWNFDENANPKRTTKLPSTANNNKNGDAEDVPSRDPEGMPSQEAASGASQPINNGGEVSNV